MRLTRLIGTAAIAVTVVTVVVAGQTKPASRPAPPKPAAAAPSTPSTPDHVVPFKVHEVLTYDISWSSMITGGTASLDVRERRTLASGRTGYYIAAEANPRPILQKLFPFTYKADTLIDTKLLLPIQASTFSDERGRTRLKTTKFPASGTTIEYEVKTATVVHDRRQVPQYSQDPLSVLYFLRSFPFKQGDNIPRIPITDGGEVFYVHVQFGGPSQIKTGAGTFPAWQIDLTLLDDKGQASDKKLTLWLSADARRIPVRFDVGLPVGSFVLTLAHITP
jgi:hypothetical protein